MKKEFLKLEKVIDLHDKIIEEFGGLKGLISVESLDAALNKPFTGLSNGIEFFPDLFDKAAALLEGIIRLHPFVDGNKRTAAILTKLFLVENWYIWEFKDREIVDFVINIAQNKLAFQKIKQWIIERIILA